METFSICCGIVLAPILILAWLAICSLAKPSKKVIVIGLVVICLPFAVAAIGMGKFMFLDEELRSACYDGDLPKVKRLIMFGANVNMNDDGVTPLCGATYNGHEEVSLYLLDHGAQPENCHDATLMDLAKNQNMRKLVQALKEKGIKE